jgi:hypothetical protein
MPAEAVGVILSGLLPVECRHFLSTGFLLWTRPETGRGGGLGRRRREGREERDGTGAGGIWNPGNQGISNPNQKQISPKSETILGEK